MPLECRAEMRSNPACSPEMHMCSGGATMRWTDKLKNVQMDIQPGKPRDLATLSCQRVPAQTYTVTQLITDEVTGAAAYLPYIQPH